MIITFGRFAQYQDDIRNIYEKISSLNKKNKSIEIEWIKFLNGASGERYASAVISIGKRALKKEIGKKEIIHSYDSLKRGIEQYYQILKKWQSFSSGNIWIKDKIIEFNKIFKEVEKIYSKEIEDE